MSRNNQIVMQRDTVKGTIQNKTFISLLKTLSYVITGRLNFANERIGELATMDDGEEYSVFRKVIVDPRQDQPIQSNDLSLKGYFNDRSAIITYHQQDYERIFSGIAPNRYS